MLKRHHDALKDFELTILANNESLKQIDKNLLAGFTGLTTEVAKALAMSFDVSANFSLQETAWPLQGQIKAARKLGPSTVDGRLLVPDNWSSYLLTLKARAPFLTFNLQDVYKNILGIKRLQPVMRKNKPLQELVVGLFNPQFMPGQTQEEFIELLAAAFPNFRIKDISEISAQGDYSNALYVGPATFESLKLCDQGARGMFFSSAFQGFNLLPYGEGHYFISTRGQVPSAANFFRIISCEINETDLPEDYPYSVYQFDEENLFGSYLRSLNQSDESYPIYQSHVVLWNFVLNLFDVNLEVIRCSEEQIKLLKAQTEVLVKIIRLYDYAMSSIDIIHQQAKAQESDVNQIQGHAKNLKEIEEITDKISQSHIFLRPILDFYRIRRGQSMGDKLLEQAQDSFLVYSEEHQTLRALLELFTVTLEKNDVTI